MGCQITKKNHYDETFNELIYFISPRNDVSNLVFKLLAEIFRPNKNINFANAASVVMSFPEIIPISLY
jgi:hypothetical protein